MSLFTRLLSVLPICAFCVCIAGAQELKPLEEIPLPAYEPVAADIAKSLSFPLLLSASQTKRIEKSLAREVDNKALRIVRQYELLSDEMRQKRYELRDALYAMYQLRRDVADTARATLPPAKQEQLDPLVYEGRFMNAAPKLSVVPQAESGDEVVETTTTLPNGQVVKKKIIIRRKKKKEEKPEISGADAVLELQFDSLIYTAQP
ncbi:MAG: hypothetical protein GX410_00520 [Elusimicrobia bacterium]|nr:hypothetical protein [Elusimicrobiota bacterium]